MAKANYMARFSSYKESILLVNDIYDLTKKFPKEEQFGLTNQIRRSAVSVPSNIAEGSARESAKETIRFLYIALGSLAELETQLIIAKETGFLTDRKYDFKRGMGNLLFL